MLGEMLAANGTPDARQVADQATIEAVVAGAPAALDTLKELADALGDDASYAATITTALALKAPLASAAFTGNPTAPTQAAADNSTKLATTAYVDRAIAETGLLPTQYALAKSLTGLNPLDFWCADLVNGGDIASKGAAGANTTLLKQGAPVYQSDLDGKLGIATAAATGAYHKRTFTPAQTSFLIAARMGWRSTPGASGYVALMTNWDGINRGWGLGIRVSNGSLRLAINDGIVNVDTLDIAPGVLAVDGPALDIVLQLDWASLVAPVARLRWSRDGANLGSQTITGLNGLLSLTFPTLLSIGADQVGSWDGGAWWQRKYMATGSQVQGVNLPLSVSQGLGFE